MNIKDVRGARCKVLGKNKKATTPRRCSCLCIPHLRGVNLVRNHAPCTLHLAQMLIAALVAGAVFFVFIEPAAAVWVWTPKTKKWENPRQTAKDTPKAQFEAAIAYFNSGDYKNAQREFRQLLKTYGSSEFASEAQYYVGRCYYQQQQYYEAFLAYQKVIDTYPYNDRIEQIIEEQYNIGKMFYEGYKSKVLGMAILPSIDKAIEVFSKVVENAPYGKYAEKAQYYLGLSYKKMLQYKEATDALTKLIEEYPQSPLLEDAKFQIGRCYAEAAPKPGYDQENTEKSMKEFKELVQTSPEGGKAKEASQFLTGLEEKKAESVFGAAKFYERINKYNSAAIYYKEILDEYPKTSSAAKALERLEVLKAKGKI